MSNRIEDTADHRRELPAMHRLRAVLREERRKRKGRTSKKGKGSHAQDEKDD